MRRFGLFQCACILWAINVVLVVLSYFVKGLIYSALILIPAVLVMWGLYIALSRKDKIKPNVLWEKSANWCKIIAAASVLYTLVNFVICMMVLRDGGPHIDNGVYCLWNHGFVREITKAEYDSLRLVEGRLFTGHELAFSAIPLVFYSARRNIKRT